MRLSRLVPWVGLGLFSGCALQNGPSFNCQTATSSVEALICQQPDLAYLDRQLDTTLRSSRIRIQPSEQQRLDSEQQRWLEQRDQCWGGDMPIFCITTHYRYRIAQLQARYALVETTGPFIYQCDDSEGDLVVAMFYATDPPTAIATRGTQTAELYLQPSGSGARYEGEDVTLWSRGDEAEIRWGFQALGNPAMNCKINP